MAECQHEDFAAKVDVYRLHEEGTDSVHSFVADVSIRCADCDAEFGFKCPKGVGFSFSEPMVNGSAKEIHLPLLSPTELQLTGPLAGFVNSRSEAEDEGGSNA